MLGYRGIQFQPSEIAKGTYVLATAQILSAMQTGNGADKNAFRFILIVGVLIVPLIFFENLSTAVLLCAVIFMMMIIGRVPMIQLGKLLGLAGLLASLAFVSVMCLGKDTRQTDSQKQKVEVTVSTLLTVLRAILEELKTSSPSSWRERFTVVSTTL